MNSTYRIINIFKAMFVIVLAYTLSFSAIAQKQKVRIKLEYHNIDGIKMLNAKVITKIDRAYVPVPNVEVHFFNNEESEDNKLAEVITGKDGKIQFGLTNSNIIMSDDSTYIFYASVINNPDYKDKSTDIEVREVNFTLKCEVVDTVKTVLININNLVKEPVADVAIKLYVKRLFGLLPIGDDYLTTNNKGELKMEFPDDIPGDKNGVIEVIAKVEDNDDFGNLEIHQQVKWGVPITSITTESKRTLWANRDNAPIYLVVTANSIILGIWFVILYIVYQLFALKKIGKNIN